MRRYLDKLRPLSIQSDYNESQEDMHDGPQFPALTCAHPSTNDRFGYLWYLWRYLKPFILKFFKTEIMWARSARGEKEKNKWDVASDRESDIVNSIRQASKWAEEKLDRACAVDRVFAVVSLLRSSITEKLDCASVVDQEEHCSSCQRRRCVGTSVRFLQKRAEILRVFFTAV